MTASMGFGMGHGPDALGRSRTNARTVRGATLLWQYKHGNTECPTVAQLIHDGIVDPQFSALDAWGLPFELRCMGEAVTVRSLGADTLRGTADDIVVPE